MYSRTAVIILDKAQIPLIQTKCKFTGKYALSSIPYQTLWRGQDNLSFGLFPMHETLLSISKPNLNKWSHNVDQTEK